MMTLLVLLWTLGAGILPAPRLPTPPRALWVWNTEALRNDKKAQDDFFAFLVAPHDRTDHAIGTLFFDGMTPPDFTNPEKASALRRFLVRAHALKLHVEFLCGDAAWAEAQHHAEALAFLSATLEFNKKGSARERFDGLQYDVEPYVLKAWPSPALRASYLLLLEKAGRIARAARQPDFVLGAAIPRFFSNDALEKLDEEVLKRVDYVALMDYVHTPEALVEGATRVIERARRLGKRVWIGVETQELKDEPTATFFAVGEAGMERAFEAARQQNVGQSSFAGFAVHYWDSYRVLKP